MNKKIVGFAVCIFVALIAFALWNLYYILPTSEARPQIQSYIDRHYENKFKISTIEKDYCPDLFHQPWGYNIILRDSNNLEFGPIKMQYNKYQKSWITYGGTDITKEYKKTKKNSE